ncbi:THAP domain-containing protein 6-like [Girardinichthys multiradiatus]|uniref:THAP domain-containing protein 6-like n=1 Tax=Girardinichthys multiradiatus TaxID=208333 RepID=UPI001FADA4DE|nr:THAP domain-containing protein 6-like [Girardinichthys multiradiatus]
MPHSCAALDCTKRFTVQTRSSGITFHRFPKESGMKKRWVKALRRKGFSPSTASRICSEHFKQEDFDRTGQTVRLRDGVVPSVFSFSACSKRRRAAKTTKTSSKKQETQIVDSSPPAQEPEPLPNPDLDHSYALPPSLGDLKAKLSEALNRVESLEREMRNAKDRERRAKNALHVLVEDLKGKNLINEKLKQSLDL